MDKLLTVKDLALRWQVTERTIREWIKDNKIKTDLPINWDKTLQLWEQNQEAYNNRQLIRQEEKEIFKFKYNKRNARYNNQCFFDFQVNREIKKKLKLHIKEGSIDAFNLND